MREFLLKISLFITIYIGLQSAYAQDNIRFKTYSPAEGLSRNIRTVIQDDLGYIWIGTEDGLFKFDGYNYKSYYHEIDDENSLSSSVIQKILCDSKGNIWVATEGGGLNCLNPFSDSIKHFLKKPDYQSSTNTTYVLCIFEDKDGNIWFGTEGGGLYKINKNSNDFENFRFSETENSISSNDVYCIYQTDNDIFWIGTREGIDIFDYKNKTFLHILTEENGTWNLGEIIFQIIENPKGIFWFATQEKGFYKYNVDNNELENFSVDLKNKNSIKNNVVNDLLFDKKGQLWIATDGGLSVFDTLSGKITTYQELDNDENSLSSNLIWDIYIDNSGTLWIGTVVGKGLHALRPTKNFHNFYHKADDKNSLSCTYIRFIYEDSEGLIWIGTNTGGLNIYNKENQNIIRVNEKTNFNSKLKNQFITCCNEDIYGRLWFGAWGKGIIVYDKKTNEVVEYKPNENDSSSLGSSAIQFIRYDNDNNLWIGSDDAVLSKYNPDKDNFTNYYHDQKDSTTICWGGLQSLAFYDDKRGNLWLGSWGGISVFNKKNQKVTRINTTNSELRDLRVISIYGTDSVIWFGTYGGGLNKYNINNQLFTIYFERHGLPDNTIFAILPDENGNLWLSTVDGLSKFNIADETFENYTVDDGIQDNEFFWGAALKDKSGKMYFGGVNGITAFFPEEIAANKDTPQVLITDFKIFNKSVKYGEKNSPLKKPIFYTDKIEISSKQYVISFNFIVLDYICPDKNKYAYMMENFDEDWIYTDLREVTYMNLKPGKYIFKVKGANSDGVWNEKNINITIKPPFWETIWFKISVILFVLTSTFLGFILRIRAIKKKKEQLEKLVKERTSELNKEKEFLKKANLEITMINAELKQQKEEVVAQRDSIEEQNLILQDKNYEIENQNKIIAQKNQSITESINYAAKIQEAILTPKSLINKLLKEYFILFRPRDIVSGDFYFVKKIDDYTVIIVADCTGHGVPGAFMSVLGITLLNEQLRDKTKLNNPELILNSLRKEIMQSLRQTNDIQSTRDGMDIGICICNFDNKSIKFAAAQHILIQIRNNELIELRGDKMPIGFHILKYKDFKSQEIKIEEKDVFYMFTDGYSDQFDEKSKEKFYLKNFKSLLLENSSLPMNEQKFILENQLEKWKGNSEQIDDILVMGWKI